jgi:hypothetical protein
MFDTLLLNHHYTATLHYTSATLRYTLFVRILEYDFYLIKETRVDFTPQIQINKQESSENSIRLDEPHPYPVRSLTYHTEHSRADEVTVYRIPPYTGVFQMWDDTKRHQVPGGKNKSYKLFYHVTFELYETFVVNVMIRIYNRVPKSR